MRWSFPLRPRANGGASSASLGRNASLHRTLVRCRRALPSRFSMHEFVAILDLQRRKANGGTNSASPRRDAALHRTLVRRRRAPRSTVQKTRSRGRADPGCAISTINCRSRTRRRRWTRPWCWRRSRSSRRCWSSRRRWRTCGCRCCSGCSRRCRGGSW